MPTYNQLPPLTKAAIDKIGEMFYTDWQQFFNTCDQDSDYIKSSAAGVAVNAPDHAHARHQKVSKAQWVEVLERFGMLTDPIKAELGV